MPIACGVCAHRLDTCGSRAGKEIQKLRRELKGLRFHPGIRKKPGRDGRKDKCHKTVAQLQYSGKADRHVHDALDRPSGGRVETIFFSHGPFCVCQSGSRSASSS